MLAITFLTTSIFQVNLLVKNKKIGLTINITTLIIMLFMVVGRTISGVHWLSDICGAIILSGFLIFVYLCLAKYIQILLKKVNERYQNMKNF